MNLYTLSDQQHLSTKEQYQYKIDRNKIKSNKELDFREDRSYLYIFHAHKIPPHLGLIVNNLFYSLKANGVDFGLSNHKINALLNRKEISTLVVEIDIDIDQQVEKVFNAYGDNIAEGRTCLNPISEFLFGHSKHSKVGELLKDLQDMNAIRALYGFYLPDNFNGIFNYSEEDINARIKNLQQ